jgi:hypothetical protein
MKALQMLDHVCLWYAQIFVIVLLLFASLAVWASYTHPVGDIRSHSPLDNSYLFLVRAVFWIICLQNLNSRITRLCLGLSAGLFFTLNCFALVGLGMMERFVAHRGHSFTTTFMELVFVGVFLSIAGYGSMLWVSLRPPNAFQPTSSLHHPLSQSC